MKLLKKAFDSCKYGLAIFAGVMAVAAVNKTLFTPSPRRYVMYLLDGKIGFTSRTLVGTVLNLFIKEYTPQKLEVFSVAVTIAAMFIFSMYIGYFIHKAQKEDRRHLGVFIILISFVVLNLCGLKSQYDVFWSLLVLLSLLFYQNKWLRWLLPLLCFAGLMINPAYLLTFLPFVFAMMLSDISQKGEKGVSKSKTALFAASFGVSFVSSVYFFFFETRYLKMNREQFYEYLFKKMDFTGIDTQLTYEYVDGYFFNLFEGKDISGAWQRLQELFKYNVVKYDILLLLSVLIAVPMLIFFVAVWRDCLKQLPKEREKGDYTKWIYRMNMIYILMLLPALVGSPDVSRFLGHYVLAQLLLLCYHIQNKNPHVMPAIRSRLDWLTKRPHYAVIFVAVCIVVLGVALS